MNREKFNQQIKKLFEDHEKLITSTNEKIEKNNGIFYFKAKLSFIKICLM